MPLYFGIFHCTFLNIQSKLNWKTEIHFPNYSDKLEEYQLEDDGFGMGDSTVALCNGIHR